MRQTSLSTIILPVGFSDLKATGNFFLPGTGDDGKTEPGNPSEEFCARPELLSHYEDAITATQK